MLKKLSFSLTIFVLSFLLVGCNSKTTKEGSITIEHELGTTTLEEPAKRVVVLEWIYGENMLALGVEPVGMTDIPGFKKWVNIGMEFSNQVVNLGTRGAANLEEIAALEPDLIISASYYQYDYDLLSTIAPTVVLNPYPVEGGIGEYGHMISSIEVVAKLIGKEEKATEVIDGLNTAYQAANVKLQESVNDFNYIQVIDFSTIDTFSMYLYTDTSIHSAIFEKIGFNNLYKPTKFELYGQTNINIENLVGLDTNYLFVVANEGMDVFNSGLISQNVLDNLGFYRDEKIIYLGENASPFGPLSTLTFVDTIVDAFSINE